jgi:hypothetical protein
MRFSLVAVLLTGLFAFAHPILAQSSFVDPDMEAPVLEANPMEPVPEFFFQSPLPQPRAPEVSQEQSTLNEAKAAEDRYRTTVQSLAGKKDQFVHCKLKNGKVLTGTVRDNGPETFILHSNILSDGIRVYYKDLAEAPRPVPAVGTRFKQGAQWVGSVAFIVVFFIPLAIMGVIPEC